MSRRSTLHRIRGTAVLGVIVLSLLYLSTCYQRVPRSNEAATILQWMRDGGYEILLPKIQVGPPALTKQRPQGSGGGDRVTDGDHQEHKQPQQPMDPLEKEFFSWRDEEYEMKQKPPPKPAREPVKPIPDPFPLLSQNPVGDVLAKLQVPDINRPPALHVPEETPLLIGFTRNWPQLIQCVSSYIAAGWPPEDIHVVENTGVMFSNRDNLLTLQNPFYLNHTQLRMLGVDVIVTPTLLTFAQLQNFYAWTALERNWTQFFWSHQDVVVFSFEKEFRHNSPDSHKLANYSLYARAVAILRYLRQPGIPKWANHFFAYDHLTLVNRDAILDVGGWDTHIPFYATDCDMYDRLQWAGYFQGSTQIAIILDTSTVFEDVAALFRLPGAHATFPGDPGPDRSAPKDESEDTRQRREVEFQGQETARKKLVETQGETIENLIQVAYRMQMIKYIGGGWYRNLWQLRQSGGQGEPFYRDPEGFQIGLEMLIETGRRVFAEKYGHRGCDIAFMGIKAEDAWRIQRDWDPETEGTGSEGPYW